MDEKTKIFREIGGRLRTFAEKGYGDRWKNQKEFAEMLELRKTDIGRYFKGESVLGGYKLYLLATEGDCDINWLLTGKSREPANREEIRKEEREKLLSIIKNI